MLSALQISAGKALSVKPNRVISEPQMLSRFQIPATKWPASSLSWNPPRWSNAPGNYSKFQIPSSYVISKPPQDVSATKNLKCCPDFRFQQRNGRQGTSWNPPRRSNAECTPDFRLPEIDFSKLLHPRCPCTWKKSQMRLSLPDFSQQARFLNPTGLGRKLKCCPDFRFRQRKWPASYVLKPTNMIQCRMYVPPDSQPAMSLNPPSPRSPWKQTPQMRPVS